jgi:hypothetical protein
MHGFSSLRLLSQFAHLGQDLWRCEDLHIEGDQSSDFQRLRLPACMQFNCRSAVNLGEIVRKVTCTRRNVLVRDKFTCQ